MIKLEREECGSFNVFDWSWVSVVRAVFQDLKFKHETDNRHVLLSPAPLGLRRFGVVKI